MLYKTETHLHTKESSSCSEVSSKEMILLYKNERYKTIIITDHYSYNKFERYGLDNWNDKIDRLLDGYKMLPIVILTAFISTIATYIDKHSK